jgi:hypothetical protein
VERVHIQIPKVTKISRIKVTLFTSLKRSMLIHGSVIIQLPVCRHLLRHPWDMFMHRLSVNTSTMIITAHSPALLHPLSALTNGHVISQRRKQQPLPGISAVETFSLARALRCALILVCQSGSPWAKETMCISVSQKL